MSSTLYGIIITVVIALITVIGVVVAIDRIAFKKVKKRWFVELIPLIIIWSVFGSAVILEAFGAR